MINSDSFANENNKEHNEKWPFILMSRTNETKHTEWHETCKCERKFGANACNNKQGWNKDKCRCECKELIDKGLCDKGFIWNPSNCDREFDKACNVREYLDYENCKCRKKKSCTIN